MRQSSRDKVNDALANFIPRYVIVETFKAYGEPSHATLRVRPVKEEGFPDGTRVQSSRKMRTNHPVGTRFKIYLSLRETGDGPCLYAHHDAPYTVVSKA
jgi:hypothetical protein